MHGFVGQSIQWPANKVSLEGSEMDYVVEGSPVLLGTDFKFNRYSADAQCGAADVDDEQPAGVSRRLLKGGGAAGTIRESSVVARSLPY